MVEQKKDKSAEWLAWRNTGLGSSDAPVIMGLSEWATPYQLWEEKTGKTERDQSTSYIQDKGNKVEVFARAQYEIMTGHDFSARQGQHKDHPFLLASADGFNEELNKGCEFKLASKADHEGVKNGICPQKYYPQVQHLMFVFGAKEWDYGSYLVEKGQPLESGELLILTVKPDIEWLVSYLAQATYFWNCIQADTPPELTDKDARLIKDKNLIEVAKRLIVEKAALAAQEKIVEEIETVLKEAAALIPRAMFGDTGVVIKKSWRKGNVKYADIPELLGVDLEPYRGPSSQMVKIDLPKTKK